MVGFLSCSARQQANYSELLEFLGTQPSLLDGFGASFGWSPLQSVPSSVPIFGAIL